MAESVWDYPRPPRLEPCSRHVVVMHRGRVIVDTRQALRVLETSHPPVYYLPRADLQVPVTLAAGRSYCEFKGEASYWDLIVDDLVVVSAAWSYERPTASYAQLAGRLAFYPARIDQCTVDGEVVLAQPGDFYGGWITSDVVGPFKGGAGTAGW